MAQVQEVVALSLIYPDEFRLLSSRTFFQQPQPQRPQHAGEFALLDEDPPHYEHPIRYSVLLSAAAAASSGSSRVSLMVEYPPNYPDVAPLFSFVEEDGDSDSDEHPPQDEPEKEHNNSLQLRLLLEAVQAEVEIGMPCVLQCVQAGRDYLEGIIMIARGDGAVHDDDDDNSSNHKKKPDDEMKSTDEEEVTFWKQQQDGITAKNSPIGKTSPVPFSISFSIGTAACAIKVACPSPRARYEPWWSAVLSGRCRRRPSLIQEPTTTTTTNGPATTARQRRLGMTVDGVRFAPWALDVRHAREEQVHRSYHEQLWRKERAVRFDLSYNSPEQQPRPCWHCREGLGDTQAAPSYRTWTTTSTTAAARQFTFHYARMTKPILSTPNNHTKHWFLVRVRLRAQRAADGDVWVGLVRGGEDTASVQVPSSVLLEPGGGYGAESEQCALLNVISGENAGDGHPMEVNLGLRVQNGSVSYGIPVGAYLGRPMFNHGKVRSEILNSSRTRTMGGSDASMCYYLAVVAATTTEQTDFHASVTVQECTQREFEREMIDPYNYL